jgi:HAD superfamily 5'-nucleotidase-like hydrolase
MAGMTEHLTSPSIPPERRIYSSRTLNLRSIGAIGYDMDYTLVHYKTDAWEERAYARMRELLADEGWPVGGLEFDPDLVIRGLVIDVELGNIVKPNRFGYVVRAAHGTRRLAFDEQRAIYRHTPVDLASPRFVFLNTLFALSECCLYAQLVDRYDARLDRFPNVHSYTDLYRKVRSSVERAHVEGVIKKEITDNPERYVEPDPEAPVALLDQLDAGKRLMLISNAEWPYARELMAWAFDPFLPGKMTWRDLFELIILQARKPVFFAHPLPLFSIADEDQGLLKPVAGPLSSPGLYVGGDAMKVESYLGLSGAEILYVGDHVFADVRVSKVELRWRTALILRELEEEISHIRAFDSDQDRLTTMMAEKVRYEHILSLARLDLQRKRFGRDSAPEQSTGDLENRIATLRAHLLDLDAAIGPLAKAASSLNNERWGLLLRAGNDKSHLAHQLERSADVYTSRVSNFMPASPFAFLRSSRGSMPHDPSPPHAPAP